MAESEPLASGSVCWQTHIRGKRNRSQKREGKACRADGFTNVVQLYKR